MAKFINPFTDVGFKIIFGQEMTKDLLIDFLNDLLVGERHIQDITFLDKELQLQAIFCPLACCVFPFLPLFLPVIQSMEAKTHTYHFFRCRLK